MFAHAISAMASAALALGLGVTASHAQSQLLGVAPSQEARSALESVTKSPTLGLTTETQNVMVQGGDDGFGASTGETVELPFAVPNVMILTLRPDINQEELRALLEERGLTVVDTFPNLNAIQVEADLSQFFQPQLGDNDANQTLLRGAVEASEAFKSDPRVIAASPDIILESKGNHTDDNDLLPQVESHANLSGAGEQTDWGIADIEADQIWTVPGAQDGAILGVMDTGFNRHDDLTYMRFPPGQTAADHGNHVAGIACARHDGVGTRGVIPNCFVMPRSGDVFPIATDGGNVLRFLTRFSQIMRTLDDFVASNQQVRAYNVSLGYNWVPNFGINIDDAGSGLYRQLVAGQGELLINALARAQDRGAVIFSAAGNDSRGLATPINAQFSSPFNWAAIEARRRGVASNTLIVEAHDQTGNRAAFSNVGGDISCPGVGILSTVSLDENGILSPTAYGTMSGTSMASPYCAGGAILLGLVRPGYQGADLINCLTTSTDLSDSGVPRLKLSQALNACPPLVQ